MTSILLFECQGKIGKSRKKKKKHEFSGSITLNRNQIAHFSKVYLLEDPKRTKVTYKFTACNCFFTLFTGVLKRPNNELLKYYRVVYITQCPL